jgi:DNA invertase Pin-like site-specific DNA recombinase
MTTRPHRAAIYARVSTFEQTAENQLAEVRRYVENRGWTAREYVDTGVSGSKDRRPALDELVRDAKRRRFDVVVCWKLDRLGRNLKHLIALLEDFQALGVAFVSLAEGIDATTPAGRLQMHILGAIAEFERARIAERVRLGLARVKAEGRQLGRPKLQVSSDRLAAVQGLSIRDAARRLGISASTAYRRLGRRPLHVGREL